MTAQVVQLPVSGEVVTAMDVSEARAITDQIKTHTEAVWNLLIQAHEGQAWLVLGYRTWAEYVQGEFNMSRRRSYQIIDQARTIQAIESAVCTTVHISERESRDLKNDLPEVITEIEDRIASTDVDTDDEKREVVAEVIAEHRARPVDVDGITADPSTGEVIEDAQVEPTVTEHTFTETIKTTTGHEMQPRDPKQILTGSAAEQHNADTNCAVTGKALITFEAYTYPSHRARMLDTWWPMGKNNIQPMHASLFNPRDIRRIAAGLMNLADEMETHNDYA